MTKLFCALCAIDSTSDHKVKEAGTVVNGTAVCDSYEHLTIALSYISTNGGPPATQLIGDPRAKDVYTKNRTSHD